MSEPRPTTLELFEQAARSFAAAVAAGEIGKAERFLRVAFAVTILERIDEGEGAPVPGSGRGGSNR